MIDLPTAERCATFSDWIYSGEEVLHHWSAMHDYAFQYLDHGSLECGVWQDEHDVYVVFRGTEFGIADWLVNAQAATRGSMHRGFQKEVREAMRSIDAMIPAKVYYRNLYVAGHSKGGGDAVCWTAMTTHEVDRVFTFGAPAVLRGSAVESFNRQYRHDRFMNCSDKVPRVALLHALGYRHTGDLHYFDRHGEMHTNPAQSVAGDVIKGMLKDLGRPGLAAVKRHDMTEYLRLVRAQVRSVEAG